MAKEGIIVSRAKYSPGSLGIILDVAGPMDPPKIKSVLQNGAAAGAGIAAGDIIVSIANVKTPTHVFYTRLMGKFLAGETVDIVVNRGGKLLMGKAVLGKADRAFTDVEEGGWSYYPFLGEGMTFATSATLWRCMTRPQSWASRRPCRPSRPLRPWSTACVALDHE